MNKLINEELKYDGFRFNVVQKTYEKEDGKTYTRDCVNPGDAVIILPITEAGEVVFEHQFREVINSVELELPAGMIDEGESPEDAARRELEEETGTKCDNLEFLTSYYPSCGYTSEKIYIYIARNLSTGEKNLDENEEILDVQKIHIDECLKMAMENKFRHASVNIAILMYYFKYCNGGNNDR